MQHLVAPSDRSGVPCRPSPRREDFKRVPPVATFSNTRTTSERSTPDRKAAERFEVEPWPQAARLGSWKISFLREVMSGSVHPKFVREWLAEIDHVTRVDDLDRSGFAFDTDRTAFEPLDSKIGKGMVKNDSSRIHFEETSTCLMKGSTKRNVQCSQADKFCIGSSHSPISTKAREEQ